MFGFVVGFVFLSGLVGWLNGFVSNNWVFFTLINKVVGEIKVNEEVFLCLVMLVFCGIISIMFSNHYFYWSTNKLNQMILLFLAVMAGLMLTNSYLLTLVFWEYLGFVSYLLILYYSTYDTVYAANVTLVSSRFGDVGLFLICSCFLFSIDSSSIFYSLVVSFFVVIATKSAAIPFSSWLLEAMRAPTPVSCLVHSSTLVAAGVWFACNYHYNSNSELISILIVSCLFTIIVSATSALYFTDVKKIVALSTCNNISWCLVYLYMGAPLLCIMQLVSHGVAKCMLFISVGDLLSSSYSSQNSNLLSNQVNSSESNWVFIVFLALMVAGVPFNGIFFTKHLLASSLLYSVNLIVLLLILYSIYLSYFYSSRLVMLVSQPIYGSNNSIHNVYLVLSALIIVSNLLNYFFWSMYNEVIGLNYLISWGIVFSQIFGLVRGYFYGMYYSSSLWSSGLGGQDYAVKLFYWSWNKLCGVLHSLMLFRLEVATANGLFVLTQGIKSSAYAGSLVLFFLLFIISIINL
uniref:NADH:ubiquinone reductase (H(+)-translocating) n=1 Tax=Enterogyrus malmbergi TaxID=2593014 RepID=A0A6M3R5K5_9PLAT|nr:NADH dehydrogenase subunit 5 [Enterogyrus malmbergi]QJD07088.1 NADH dehydrogenase subunit 5 [Enterogyrus malmbergi]